MLDLLLAYQIALSSPKNCDRAVEAQIRQSRISSFFRPIVKSHSLKVISLINQQKLTTSSAQLFTEIRLRRIVGDRDWVKSASRDYIAQVEAVIKTGKCNGYVE
jgi:hypothetical protein